MRVTLITILKSLIKNVAIEMYIYVKCINELRTIHLERQDNKIYIASMV